LSSDGKLAGPAIPSTEAGKAASSNGNSNGSNLMTTPRPAQQQQQQQRPPSQQHQQHQQHQQQQHQLSHLSPASQAELRALLAAKREVKARLRQYDAEFAARHGGRLPSKAEKEPVRRVYERYNRLKQRIQALQTPPAPSTVAARGGSGSSSGRVSPSSRLTLAQDLPRTGGPTVPPPPPSPRQQQQQQQQQQQRQQQAAPLAFASASSKATPPSSSSSSSSLAATKVLYSSRARPLPGASPSTGSGGVMPSLASATTGRIRRRRDGEDGGGQEPEPAAAAAAGGGDPVLVVELRAEKAALHKHLRAFEKSFRAAYGRKVSMQRDILPVEREYRRYKEIKAELVRLSAAGVEEDRVI
jgi:hypothetical protein